jgi:hypothetical protein
MNTQVESPESLDLLYGLRAIATFLGVSERRARYWAGLGCLPVGRLGRTLVASKATLRRTMSDVLNAGEGANGPT